MNFFKDDTRSALAVKRNGMTKGRWICLLSFFIPVAITVLICIREGVFPFGENCILHIDMYHQYEPFFTELMDKLKNGDSLMHSFRIGLGSDFVSLFAYYLASPINWLLLLWPKDYVIEFMTLAIIIKIGLCGFSFGYYIRKHFRTTDTAVPVFATFYALSAYMAAYSWNIMWLDCLWLAPLIILGLEKLVKEKKCYLYCLTLAISILSNFYISIMICIFLVLYYVILFFEEVKTARERACSFVRFTLYSLLAGGMGAILIIPEAIILSYSGSSDFSFPQKIEFYFNIVQELARHAMGIDVYTGRDHWPNLYCGVAIVLFLFLYIANRKIPLRQKIKRLTLMVFFWISFATNILDYIWHGMHYPDSLPGRQSFLYVFLLLTLAYETYHKRKGNRAVDVILAGILSIACFIAAGILSDTSMIKPESIIITCVLICGYTALFVLWYLGKKETKQMARVMVIALAVLEVYVNFHMTGFSTTSRSAYTQNWDSVKSMLAQVDETEDGFYRVEEAERLTKNDAAIYGYSSATIFSSLMNISVAEFYRKAGMEGGKNFYSYSGATPIMSAMLSVKYLISKSPYEDSPLKRMVASDGKNYIYENTYSLPMGFMVFDGMEEMWNPVIGTPIANLNKLVKVLGSQEDMLVPVAAASDVQGNVTKITVEEEGYLYATYSNREVTNITVKAGNRIRKFTKCDHGYILDLGWCKKGEVVEIQNTASQEEIPVQAYRLNIKSVETAYAAFSEQTMELTQWEDTKIEGTIQVEKEGELVLSIPKEDGWKVYVDGVKVEAGSFMDSFISIPLSRGSHTISLSYLSPGLLLGAGISLTSLTVFLLILVIKSRKRKSIPERNI